MSPKTNDNRKTTESDNLRHKAEESVENRKKAEDTLPVMNADSQHLVHELDVYQTEFEMQNEELKQSRVELDAALNHYSDLYDFAPTGYLTLARDSAIRMINLTGAQLLGSERSRLLEKRFALFVAEEFRTSFIDFLETVFTSKEKKSLEILLNQEERKSRWVRIDAHRVDDELQECRATLVDITERKMVEETLLRQVQELMTLQKVSAICARSEDEDNLIAQITSIVGDTFYPDHFGILMVDENEQVMRTHPSYKIGKHKKSPQSVPLSSGVIGQVYITGKPHNIRDVRSASYYLPFNPGMQSNLSIPIKSNGTVLGAINAESRQLDFFKKEDERFLSIVGEQLGLTLARLRSIKRERAQYRMVKSLHQAALALTSSLHLKEVLNTLLTELAVIIPSRSSAVFLSEAEHLRLLAGQGFSAPQELINKTFSVSDPLFQRIFQSLKPVIIPDTQAEPHFQGWGDTNSTRGWMGVPIIMKDKLIGIITIDSPQPRAYTAADAEFALTFARQAASAIENAQSFEKLAQSYDATIEGWAKALEYRDDDTEGHSQRVTELALRLAEKVGLEEKELQNFRWGALLHDIGKIGIPDRILHKPGALTDDEKEEMRQHPVYSRHMLSEIPFLKDALIIPIHHHERWDGSGYPDGLSGENIPLEARIFALSDVFDALTSDRPYRKAWSQQKALAYIKKQSGTHFDPELTRIFLDLEEFNAE